MENKKTTPSAQRTSKRLLIAAGSALGILASVTGLIAAFSPDTLNLTKKRFSEFSVQVDGPRSVRALDDFLQSQRGNIVKLDVSVCVVREVQCPLITAEGTSLTAKFSNDNAEFCDGGANQYLEGVAFHFDQSDSKDNFWGWEKFEKCKNGDEDGVSRVSGYFLVPQGSGFGQGWTEWMLSPIAEKEIKLKNY